VKKLLFLGIFVSLLVGCRGLAPVQDKPMKSIVLAEGRTVKEAIIQGASTRNWSVSELVPGVMRAHLYARGHEVDVDIPYTQSGYAIQYADSKNMRYNPKTHKIHPKYNRWIEFLDIAIFKWASVGK